MLIVPSGAVCSQQFLYTVLEGAHFRFAFWRAEECGDRVI